MNGVLRPQSASGFRPIALASLLVAALGMGGCAHTNPDMTASGVPRRAAVVHAPRSHVAKLRAIRSSADARADATSAIKPAALRPIPLPDQALLKRQPPPDCEMRTKPAGVSPTDVKLATYDYERQCYRQVEGIVRGRLDALQDAVGETIRAVKARQEEGHGRAPGEVGGKQASSRGAE